MKVDSIHALLRQHIPEDALCLIGLTMMDLFEDETDLFVAGLAAGNQRVAVGIIMLLRRCALYMDSIVYPNSHLHSVNKSLIVRQPL